MGYLTPGELARLRAVRGHARMDRGDIQPMRAVFRDAQGREIRREVIPWRMALEIMPEFVDRLF